MCEGGVCEGVCVRRGMRGGMSENVMICVREGVRQYVRGIRGYEKRNVRALEESYGLVSVSSSLTIVIHRIHIRPSF